MTGVQTCALPIYDRAIKLRGNANLTFGARPDITGVLSSPQIDLDRALALPELFSLAGYNRDSIADVEEFYLALRAATGTTIRQVNGAQENAMLEAIPDAPR